MLLSFRPYFYLFSLRLNRVTIYVDGKRWDRHLARGHRLTFDDKARAELTELALDEALDEAGMPLDRVFYFDVPGQELVKRLTNRASEQGRADDRPEAIERRMQVYEEQTAPVLAYYRESGRVTDIRGTGSPDEVFDRLVAASS